MKQAIADCNLTDSSDSTPTSQSVGIEPLALIRSLLFGVMSACVLLSVALFNGYPTVYPDTGSYLFTGAFLIALPPFRSPGYSIFIRLTSLGASAWLTIATQAIIVVFVLYETCKHLIGGGSKFRDHCLLAIACVLAALTSLPWEVSLLMPDVFAAVIFLSVYLLVFDGRLRLAERIALAAILAISVAAHMSLLPIAALFIAMLAIPRLAGWRPRGAPAASTMLAWLLVPILAAGLSTAALNRSMGLGFKLSPSGNQFFLGRLFGDGLTADYLRANCPKKPFVACRYLNDLPTSPEQFLFWHPLLHEMDPNGVEIAQIVRGTLAAYPFRFLASSIHQTLRQLVKFQTGQEIRDLALNAPNSNAEIIGQVFPRDVQAFSNSRLIRGRLVSLSSAVAAIDTIVVWLSAAACLILARKRRDVKLNRFFYAAIAFLAINAAICATLAGAYDRYQSRVAWLVPLCLAFYVAQRFGIGDAAIG
ncbi:MAG: hypothetical protein LAO19_16685 [Acidobacteriia bacterium]|nr:hypothetical protein [Terriglobia bacterium]